MEFFGIGASELMVILVIAVVLFGPDRIPSMAAQVGKTIREFRRYTNDLTKEFNDATGDLRQEFQNIQSDLRGELEATQADLRSQLDLTDIFKTGTTTAAVAATVPATTETDTLAATAVTSADVATFTPEPEPASTITVTTPYADALAASQAEGGAISDLPTLLPATKADPFADLVALTVSEQRASSITVVDTAPVAESEMVAVASNGVAAPEAVEELAPVTTNGHKRVVGGSVAGSKYSRRKSG